MVTNLTQFKYPFHPIKMFEPQAVVNAKSEREETIEQIVKGCPYLGYYSRLTNPSTKLFRYVKVTLNKERYTKSWFKRLFSPTPHLSRNDKLCAGRAFINCDPLMKFELHVGDEYVEIWKKIHPVAYRRSVDQHVHWNDGSDLHILSDALSASI